MGQMGEAQCEFFTSVWSSFLLCVRQAFTWTSQILTKTHSSTFVFLLWYFKWRTTAVLISKYSLLIAMNAKSCSLTTAPKELCHLTGWFGFGWGGVGVCYRATYHHKLIHTTYLHCQITAVSPGWFMSSGSESLFAALLTGVLSGSEESWWSSFFGLSIRMGRRSTWYQVENIYIHINKWNSTCSTNTKQDEQGCIIWMHKYKCWD